MGNVCTADHVPGRETRLHKSETTEATRRLLSAHEEPTEQQEVSGKIPPRLQVKEQTSEQPTRQRLSTQRAYVELNENENTTYRNWWDAANVTLGGKLIALNAGVSKGKRSKTNHPTLHLRKREAAAAIESPVSTGRERSTPRAHGSGTDNGKSTQKVGETEPGSLKRGSRGGEKDTMSETRGDITTDPVDRGTQLCAHRYDDQFSEGHDPPPLTQG